MTPHGVFLFPHLKMISSVIANFRSLRRLASGLLAVGTVLAPTVTSAQTVDFEGLGYNTGCQWGGGDSFASLDGKAWGGFRPLDLTNYTTQCMRVSNTGYSLLQTGYVGNVIALGAGTAWLSSGSPFVLKSMVAGAGWQDPTSLTLNFWLNGLQMGSTTISLNTSQTGALKYTGFYSGPTDYIDFTPDYTGGADTFNSYGESCIGAVTACTQHEYQTWFVDNLDFSPATVLVTPEPATLGMLGIGMLAMGVAARRRRRA